MRSILVCGQRSKKTNKPRITRPIHWSRQDDDSTLSTFGGHNSIFEVTRGQFWLVDKIPRKAIGLGLPTHILESIG